MFRRIILSSLIIAFTGQASALSCVPWDAAGAYSRAAESERRFVIGHGQFLRTSNDMPGPTDPHAPEAQPYSFDALFIGNLASRAGFNAPVELEVSVEVVCMAHWCGGIDEGQEALVFLEVDEDRNYSLVSGPCPFSFIPNPSREDLSQITACMAGRACESQF